MNKYSFYLFALLFFLPLKAHEFNPAHLIIEESEDFKYDIVWMYPIRNLGPVDLSLPKDCESSSVEVFQESKYLSEKISMQCESTIKGKPIFINGLSILNDALVTVKSVSYTHLTLPTT